MSQEDTYRPAILPSEAVMMPAMEEAADAPLPAAQGELPPEDPSMRPAWDSMPPEDPSMRPAQRSNMSLELEKLRSTSRVPPNVEWMNAAAAPLGRSAEQAPPRQGPPGQPPEGPVNRHATIGQGSALTSLMRSAARQLNPAPSLMPPQAPPTAQGPAQRQPMEGPQMRGALRQVVRSAQQPPS